MTINRPEGYYHSPLEPPEEPPFCDQCGYFHAGDFDCSGDDDDGYPGPCSDPGGHVWPRDIEESERCLCIHCGTDGDA